MANSTTQEQAREIFDAIRFYAECNMQDILKSDESCIAIALGGGLPGCRCRQ